MNREKISNSRLFVFDLDGVVYRGEQLIDGVKEGLDSLRKCGKKIKFLTNSSKVGSDGITRKLNDLGIQCESVDVMTSATASAAYMCEQSRKNIYVIGEMGLKEEILKVGLNVVDNPEHADALLVGLDTHFSYKHICEAMVCVRAGCYFAACNRDPNYPVSSKKCLPGCGPIVSAIEVACGKQADVEIGKPNTYMLKLLLERKASTPEHIVIVGDSIDSDMALAVNYGVPGIHINERYDEQNISQNESYFKSKSVLQLSEMIAECVQ